MDSRAEPKSANIRTMENPWRSSKRVVTTALARAIAYPDLLVSERSSHSNYTWGDICDLVHTLPVHLGTAVPISLPTYLEYLNNSVSLAQAWLKWLTYDAWFRLYCLCHVVAARHTRLASSKPFSSILSGNISFLLVPNH